MMNTLSSLSSITTVAKNAIPIPYSGVMFNTYIDISSKFVDNGNMYYGSNISSSDALLITCNTTGEQLMYYGRNRIQTNVIYYFQSDNSGNSFTTTTLSSSTAGSNTNSIVSGCMSSDGVIRYILYLVSSGTSSVNPVYYVYTSTDSGQNFSALSDIPVIPGGNGRSPRYICCSKNGKYVLVCVYSASQSSPCTLLSTNYGAGLTNIASPLNNVVQLGTIISGWISDDGLRILLGANRVGLYYVTNTHTNDVINTTPTFTNILDFTTANVKNGNSIDITVTFSNMCVSNNEKYIFFTIGGTGSGKGVYLLKNGVNTSVYSKLANAPSITSFNSSAMDYSGLVLVYSGLNGTVPTIYFSIDSGATWGSKAFSGNTLVSGLGLAPNQSVAYVALRNTGVTPITSSFYKIT